MLKLLEEITAFWFAVLRALVDRKLHGIISLKTVIIEVIVIRT